MPILRVQDADGNWVDIPAIVGAQGEKGDTGETGPQGEPGPAGKTPVPGVDYFTTADKAEIIDAVLAALPVAEEASF